MPTRWLARHGVDCGQERCSPYSCSAKARIECRDRSTRDVGAPRRDDCSIPGQQSRDVEPSQDIRISRRDRSSLRRRRRGCADQRCTEDRVLGRVRAAGVEPRRAGRRSFAPFKRAQCHGCPRDHDDNLSCSRDNDVDDHTNSQRAEARSRSRGDRPGLELGVGRPSGCFDGCHTFGRQYALLEPVFEWQRHRPRMQHVLLADRVHIWPPRRGFSDRSDLRDRCHSDCGRLVRELGQETELI